MPKNHKPNKEIDDFVEVTWSGKKLLLKRATLDEWYHGKSFEDKVQYVEDHPFVSQPVPIHRFKAVLTETPPDPDDFALVHWSGTKVLMLPKEKLNEWYNESYEKHDDFVKSNPEYILEDISGKK